MKDLFNRYKRALAALFAGALLPLAFAPFEVSLVPLASLFLLLLIWRGVTPAQAAKLGYLFGLAYFGAGVYWVYFSIHHFAHAPLWLASLIMLGMVAILACYIALIGYLLNRFFSQSTALRYLFAFPVLWLLVEYLRSVLLTGFPWLSLGFSQIDTYLAGWAPLVGVYGLSILLAFSASSVFYLVSVASWWPRILVGSLLIAVWFGGFLLAESEWSQPSGKPIKVALLQGNIPQEIKWSRSFRQPSLNIYSDMNQQASDVDLVVWPETAVPGFFHELEKSFLVNIQRQAIASKTDVVLGLPVMGEMGRYYNGLLSVRQLNTFYAKNHLVPLGEYMPLKPLSTFILDYLNIPLSDFTAGALKQPLLKAAGYPFASSICYEDVFQQASLNGLPKAAFLINVSNDTWFGDTIAPFQHLQMARMRALESGRYLLRSTNTGLTAIINHKGQVVKQAPMFERYSLRGEILPMQGATPFVKGGETARELVLWLLFLLCFLFKDNKRLD